MNIAKSILAALALCGLCLSAPLYAASEEAGVFDIGSLKAAQSGDNIELNLSSSLLSLMASASGNQDAEAAKLAKELKHIRLCVTSLDDSNREQVTEQLANIRETLTRENWKSVVNTRENGKTVQVFMKSGSNGSIEGLVISVFDKAREAVLVNIVGNIRPEEVSKLALEFNIGPLKKLNLDFRKKSAAPAS